MKNNYCNCSCTSSDNKKFLLNKSQLEKFEKWNETHKQFCQENPTAIGGRLTYSFTPTGLGIEVVVKCVCGSEIDLTEEYG